MPAHSCVGVIGAEYRIRAPEPPRHPCRCRRGPTRHIRLRRIAACPPGRPSSHPCCGRGFWAASMPPCTHTHRPSSSNVATDIHAGPCPASAGLQPASGFASTKARRQVTAGRCPASAGLQPASGPRLRLEARCARTPPYGRHRRRGDEERAYGPPLAPLASGPTARRSRRSAPKSRPASRARKGPTENTRRVTPTAKGHAENAQRPAPTANGKQTHEKGQEANDKSKRNQNPLASRNASSVTLERRQITKRPHAVPRHSHRTPRRHRSTRHTCRQDPPNHPNGS